MKKIVVEKNEGIAEVIDKIIATADPDVVLVIHKGSSIAKSTSNFRLLKREAGLAEKKIAVESMDDEIIGFAEANGIEIAGRRAAASMAPVRGISDIVAKHRDNNEDSAEEDDEEGHSARAKKAQGIKLTIHAEPLSEETERETERSFFGQERFFKSRPSLPADTSRARRDDDEEEDDEDGGRGSRGVSGKVIAWTVGLIVLVIAGFYGVTVVFGRAQVTINFTQTPWSYQNNFIADKSVATTSVSTAANGATVIPAQIFTSQKNITLSFPATGQSQSTSAKAQGTITIYNDYGASVQDLVATTRFVTPDGKIFRLVNDVAVPAATVAAGGSITPSSVDAPIIADQGGPAYDVGPVAKLTIPGFQTNPAKYAGFYGQIKGQTTGGSTTGRPVPTANDVAVGKASTTAILQADLQGSLASSYPNNFKILDGATSVQITKLSVSTSTDANGNFTVFGEATLQAIGFDESALENYLLGLAQAQAGGGTILAFKAPTPTLTYSNVQASFSKGQVSFALTGQGTLEPAFSPDQFTASVAGKGISEARDAIQSLPQLSDGKISVWPIWLWMMPSDPKKIQITVN
jgi:hypothetical protein